VRTNTVEELHFKSAWRTEIVGRDQALVCADGEAFMSFALGPATGAAKEPSRLEAILDHRVRRIRYCEQIHGRTIHEVFSAGEAVLEVGPGDGLVTSAPDVGLLVWTADCVPVLIAGDGVIAAIHSGWRGCAADIVGAAVERLAHRQSPPERLRVALGPAVCGACYETGPEVADALGRFDLDESLWLSGNHIDLRSFLSARLEALGVAPENIESIGPCTVESPDLASYRRDGAAAGRQWAMIYLNH
jgi:purine-nucleoside/S-methyl-5'-thioadenosine phosphorylase / adenosine deaminase